MTVKFCGVCKNKGIAPKCIFCGRKVRPNPIKRRKELDQKRKDEIRLLWKKATLELWLKDQAEYGRVIKRIKYLER